MADRDNQSQGRKVSLSGGGAYSLTYRPSQGVVTGGGADWFGPLNPMQPVAPPEVKGRILDFPSGYNLNVRPRSYEAVTFDMLRAFADRYDLVRLIIETRKDQLARQEWNIVPRDKKLRQRNSVIPGDLEARIGAINDFFLRPDQENFWDDWLRLLLEDLFVIDAPTLYRRKTYGGQLYALQPLDGGTIKRVIDDWGNTPETGAAYQQVLKGYPAVDYAKDELIYRPRVKRTHKVYGYSPVEQIIMTVNIGLRRQAWQLESFTEGNIPEALIGTPSQWTPDQVRQFQDWFDSVLQGNTGERRRARFVPGEVAKSYVPTKPTELFGQADEWLARIVCFAFSVSPQPFVAQMNRATAETAQETAISEGLAPIQKWVKGLMDTILIEDFNSPDLEFSWNEDEEADPNIKSQIIDREQAAGRLSFNEARKEQGLDPIDHPDADRPMFKTATGWTPIFLTPEEEAEKAAMAAQISGAVPGEDDEGGPGDGGDDGDGPKPPAGGDGGPDAPPADKEAMAKADEQERDERGRFAGSGGGAEAATADNWQDAKPTGFVGASGGPKEQTDKAVRNYTRQAKDAPEGQANRLRSIADNHQRISEQHAETAKNWSNTGHYDTARQVMGSSKFQAGLAGAIRDKASSIDAKAAKADEGVLQKGELPFVHKEGCGCGLAKAGRASKSSKSLYADPLRPFAAKKEKRLVRALKGMFGRLATDVAKQIRQKLDAVSKAEFPDDFDIDKLLDELDLSVLAITQDDLVEALAAVGADAAKISLAQVGMSIDDNKITEVVNERALAWARDRAAELVSFDEDDPLLAGASRDMLRALIADGIENNLSTDEISDNIEEAHAFSEDRADLIAATEITAANSQGALAGYEEAKDAGVNVKKSWLVLEDGCEICQENADAGPIDLDEQFPSGDDAPGAHPNCRCVLVPEVIDEDGNETEGDPEEGDDAELSDKPGFTKADNQSNMADYFPVNTALRGPIWAMGGNSEEATADREGGILQHVAFDDCIATQDYCDHDKVALYRDDPTAKGYAPMAYKIGTQSSPLYALQDGHHRAVASLLNGNGGMTMHVRPAPLGSRTED